jgi:CHAT domain-containing protein/Tfp pilus assembly protein PilF
MKRKHLFLLYFLAALVGIYFARKNPESNLKLIAFNNNKLSEYSNESDYKAAIKYAKKAKSHTRILYGKKDINYAMSLSNIAKLYQKMGDFSSALANHNKALNIVKRYGRTNHPDYAILLGNLASYYQDVGDYSKAEKLHTDALKIAKEFSGSDPFCYPISLGHFGQFYQGIGNFSKAEQLYNEAYDIARKAPGADHNKWFEVYTEEVNNLAGIYYSIGNFSKAEELYKDAIWFKDLFTGTKNFEYIRSISNLAGLYCLRGDYKKAEPLLIEALEVGKESGGTEYPQYAETLNNAGILYSSLGFYSRAEPHLKNALSIRRKLFGIDHPEYAKSLANLAKLYWSIGKYNKADSLFIEANSTLNKQIDKNFPFLSEKEKEQFLNNKLSDQFDLLNSFFLKSKGQNYYGIEISFNNELAHKGLLLQGNISMRQTVYKTKDTVLINIFDKLGENHKALSKLYSTPINSRPINVEKIEQVCEKLEKDFYAKAKDLPNLKNLIGLSKVKWQDVQQSLKPDEAAIEFVNFQYFNKRWTDSIFYCALVIRKDYKWPRMVSLFESKELEKIIGVPEASRNSNYITQLYSYKPTQISLTGDVSSTSLLYELVWQPIDSLLSGINTIYLSPSGLLNKVAFNSIPISTNNYLSDKYELNLVSSTRIITNNKFIPDSFSIHYSSAYNTILYGGIEYDIDSAELISLAGNYQRPISNDSSKSSFSPPQGNRGINWSFLEGSLIEVSDIQKIFRSKRIPATLFTGKNATEESFKQLMNNLNSPGVIHVATHGFYFPEKKLRNKELGDIVFRGGISNESSFIYSDNPLLRSGILFAGASRAWENSKPIEGVEDGILTAYEVSNMVLNNTELVVLSACETGLGDIKRAEGVYGLQRAFKMAGVKYIVMSLWQIPDYQTSELMQYFYTKYLNGMTIKDAFREAQKIMRKKYDPFYWAGFVLIE